MRPPPLAPLSNGDIEILQHARKIKKEEEEAAAAAAADAAARPRKRARSDEEEAAAGGGGGLERRLAEFIDYQKTRDEENRGILLRMLEIMEDIRSALH